MKCSIQLTIFPRLILLVFVNSAALLQLEAQTDSSLAFFPLQLNDLWQYRYHYYDCCCNYEISSYFTVRVARDTVLQDGLSYKVVEISLPELFSIRCLRVDTATANVYEFSGDMSVGPCLLDSLRATVGSVFSGIRSIQGGPIICAGIGTTTVLGMRTMVKQFTGAGIFYNLAFGLGLTQIDTMVFQCGTWDFRSDDLCYARISGKEYGTFVGMKSQIKIAPESFTMAQNYPNPFNSTTAINFQVSAVSMVKLSVYDLLGREVAVLVNERKAPGSYEVTFDGSNLASGVYFYQFRAHHTGGGQAGDPSTGPSMNSGSRATSSDSGPRAESRGFVQTKKLILLR